MKKAIVISLIVLLAFVGGLLTYGAISDATINNVTIATEAKKGDIDTFSAVTPANGVTVTEIPAFVWEEAKNADTYTLEIASNEFFDVADEYYIIKTGIVGTKYNIKADLKKDRDYYWRVTAVNGDHTEVIQGEYLTFRYQATLSEEIKVSLGYADEWKVHEVGSKATVTLDHKSFFKDKSDETDSLRISFDSEDTQRGEEYVESNGWIVVTRSLETEFYGLDAFYFNFYYSGNDARAFFRVIDEDNEYWYSEIKLASGARQTIIMPLEDFTLRTKGTPVMNEKFDYQYLKSMELVFERVDGDGVAYFSDLRAIRLQDYGHLFVENFDFRDYADILVNDSAYFDFTNTASESGDALTYAFATRNGVPEAQRGYGFVKMPLGKILATGDAFSFHVDLSGIATKNFNYLLRVIEEDDDVWVFKIAASDIPTDGNLLVPYAAFTLSEFKGDGIRQFYLVKQLQFGLSACYQGGSITVDHLSVVSLAKKVDNLYQRDVKNGLIEGFEDYENEIGVYYKWQTSTTNKDESISLYTDTALGANNTSAKFYYKTDLPEAEYRVNLLASVKDYTAIEIHAKDVPVGGHATMTVYLHGGPSELYYYQIQNLDKEWTSYVIPLSLFDLTEDSFGSRYISCENITGITIAFGSTYKVLFTPQYASGGYVCVDNLKFTTASDFAKKAVSGKIKKSATNANIAMISDFDSDDTFVHWSINKSAQYLASNSALSYSSEVTAKEGRSQQMTYKANMVAPYYADIIVDSSVSAKGLTFLLKGDNKSANVEIIITANGTNYIYKITGVSENWNTYSVGFSNFKKQGDDSVSFSAGNVSQITRVSIYIKNPNDPTYSYFMSSLYLDEIYFDNSINISTDSITPYAA